MRTIVFLFLGLFFLGCIQREREGNRENELKDNKHAPLYTLFDRFNRKKPAQEALARADRQYREEKSFSSDTLLQTALGYYINKKETSPELARIYYYQGLYYEGKNMFSKALMSYTYAADALPEEDRFSLREKLQAKLPRLGSLLGKKESENLQWKYRYEHMRVQNRHLQRQLHLWRIGCQGVASLLLLVLGFFRYRISRRRKELFQSQLFIERLQRAEDELKEKLLRELDEKDNKLKEFFRLRVVMIKEFVELSRKYGNNLEKLKDKFARMVSTDSFSPADWTLLKEGVNIMGCGILDHLQKNYPELTEENIRYCALICAGFETDELAILWDVHNDSIYKRRTRLRQKLALAKNQDLKKFFDEQITALRKKRL